MLRLVLVLLAACGRIGFDPGGGSACEMTVDQPIAIGETLSGTLCPGATDTYTVTLAAGDELVATLVPGGPGWLTIAIPGRAVETLDASSAAFADRDGVFTIAIGGVAAARGTPYALSVALRAGHHIFVAPTGDDTAPGTFAQPWRTPDPKRLVAGDVMVLEDGVYGRIDANCATTAKSGTPAQPIRVVALSERRAELASDGTDTTVRIQGGCAWWTLEGLHIENGDMVSGSSSGGVTVNTASHIVLRRLLLAHNDMLVNSQLVVVDNADHVLVEECEGYDFNHTAFSLLNSSDSTVRRCFAASRQHGDGGFQIYGDTNAIVENNIDEGNGQFSVYDGYGSGGGTGADITDTHVLGNVVLGDGFGLISSLFDTTMNHNLRTQVVDHVAIDSTTNGYYMRSNEQAQLTRCTAIRSHDVGFGADEMPTQPNIMASTTFTDSLAIDSQNIGFNVAQQRAGWQIAHSDAFGGPETFRPSAAPQLVDPQSIDPMLGGCLVYQPEGSPTRTAGIGAEVIDRYVDGVLTDVPLWHPITGAFPCGAVIAGVNDDSATSCTGVHHRLHVGTSDCPLPYGTP